MRIAIPLVFVLIAAACQAGSRLGSEPRDRVGTYAFRITLPAMSPIEGVFVIAADTVTLETDGQQCRRDPGLTGSRRVHLFNCFPPIGIDGFRLSVDSRDPAFSSWSGTQSVKKTRTVCVRYTTTPQGRTVCAESRSEDYFETVRLAGRLLITARDTTSH